MISRAPRGDFVSVVNLDGTGLSQFIVQPNCGDNPQGLDIDVAGGFLYCDAGIKSATLRARLQQ